MINLMLAIDASQWVLLGFLVVLIILMPLYMRHRNKKESDRAKQLTESIKKGDEVITTGGIIGKIVSIDEKNGLKSVTIQTGKGTNIGFTTVDINAIYVNLSATPEVVPAKEDSKNLDKATKTEEKAVVEEVVVETKPEEKVENVASSNEKKQIKKESKAQKSTKTSK